MTVATRIHSSAFIDKSVELGLGVTIGPGAVILGPCKIGDGAWIGAGASIGAPPEISSMPQQAGWDGDPGYEGIIIGARTVIRELAVLHQGSHRPTRVGSDSWILNRAYLAHDVVVGDRVTISAGVSIGGHCTIGDAANLGMNASIHQSRVIGAGAMVGMGTPLTKDVPPFGKAFGSPVHLYGVNSVGLSRQGVSENDIEALRRSYETGDLLLSALQTADPVLTNAIEAWQRAEPKKMFRGLSA